LPGGICTHGINAPWQGTQWNKIEHKLFSYVSMNWQATPLVSYRVIVNLISATTTKTGLTVHCELDQANYPKGIVVSDQQMDALNISRAEFHGEWNYTIAPCDNKERAFIS
jgi:Rhodopirellula transposase DDE domain